MDDCDPRFPLGTPINRKRVPAWVRVAGRPNWWRDPDGVEHFVDPDGFVPDQCVGDIPLPLAPAPMPENSPTSPLGSDRLTPVTGA